MLPRTSRTPARATPSPPSPRNADDGGDQGCASRARTARPRSETSSTAAGVDRLRFFFDPGMAQYPEGAAAAPPSMPPLAHLAHLRARRHELRRHSRAPQEHVRRPRPGWARLPVVHHDGPYLRGLRRRRVARHRRPLRDDEDRILRTYFVNSRGDEAMGSAWSFSTSPSTAPGEWEDSTGLPAGPALPVVDCHEVQVAA